MKTSPFYGLTKNSALIKPLGTSSTKTQYHNRVLQCTRQVVNLPNKNVNSQSDRVELARIKPVKSCADFSLISQRRPSTRRSVRVCATATEPRPETESTSHQESLAKDFQEICALSIPALGSVIADPLMSLVDTACVGQVSAVQLAALSSNTAFFNLIFQVFAFLGVATTNVFASNCCTTATSGLTPDEKKDRKQKCVTLISNALTLAAICGVVCSVLMELFPVTLLTWMGASAELMQPALTYFKIRALACPAVMVMCVCQGAYLGRQDAWTPLKIFVTAGLFNLVADFFLIMQAGTGVAGAAWATLFAQYLGAGLFVWHMRRQGEKEGVPLKWKGFPTLESLKPYADMGSALVPGAMVRMSGYALLTYQANALGTIASAAHQVTLGLFRFALFIPEPLSITAQSLIARDKKNPMKVGRVAKALLLAATTVGALIGVFILGVYNFLPYIFTSDPFVASAIQQVSPQAFISAVLLATVMIMDGISIGSGDFKHLPRGHMLSTAGCWLALNCCACTTLGHVWWALVVFFGLRFVHHVLHIAREFKTHPLGSPHPLPALPTPAELAPAAQQPAPSGPIPGTA